MHVAHRLLPQQLVASMSRRNLLLPACAILLLLAVWSWRLQPTSFEWSGTGGRGHGPIAGVLQPPAPNTVDLSDPEAPFVGWPLQRVCDEATYVEGLVFICDNNSGGIGNIRNYIQTCVRYAIEAGATSLVMPKIRQRSADNLENLFTDYLPLSYMFDEEHFKHAWTTYCPQITLYGNVTDIPNYIRAVDGQPAIQEITPKEFGNRGGCDWKDQNRHTDRFGQTFRGWLRNETYGTPPTKETPRLIRFKWGVLWDWPVYKDGPEFAATFGHLLKFNKQLLRLGKVVLKNMHGFAKSQGAASGEFLGAHLRTESDAMSFWPVYDTQAPAYLDKAIERGFKAAYLATGNSTEAKKFANDAAEKANLRVVTKRELLTDKDREELDSLTWDQQGLVDFIALLGSTYFVGPMPSSFSVYMTLKRHLKTGGIYYRPYKPGTDGDGFSYMVGHFDQYWEDWLFMFDGMWP
ncbi:hypothetical protein PG994_012859 [Apiospora phragmitis]|uniref:Alternative oxidase n=1 Tax=Apiospora phragmitis TaxID=2905665 RepID=A0ABR1T705_9PEZI